jgi:hypothetical protein
MIRYVAPMEIKIRPGRISREALLLMLLANPGKPLVRKPHK